MLKHRGFTLPEALLALALSSVVWLSIAQLYPQLRQQSEQLQLGYRLDQTLRQLALTLEKDLRRAGFCQGNCVGRAWWVGQFAGELLGSCIIVAYDLNGNGRWEGVGENEPESFGYRLRRGALEGQRGVSHCQGGDWEQLLEGQAIAVTRFFIARTASVGGGGAMITLHLEAHWRQRPEIRSVLQRAFIGENL